MMPHGEGTPRGAEILQLAARCDLISHLNQKEETP